MNPLGTGGKSLPLRCIAMSAKPQNESPIGRSNMAKKTITKTQTPANAAKKASAGKPAKAKTAVRRSE